MVAIITLRSEMDENKESRAWLLGTKPSFDTYQSYDAGQVT